MCFSWHFKSHIIQTFTAIKEIFSKHLNAQEFQVDQLYALDVPHLARLFYQRRDNMELREPVMTIAQLTTFEKLQEIIEKYEWNSIKKEKAKKAPVVFGVHGTNVQSAKHIFQGGFEVFSTTDAGF